MTANINTPNKKAGEIHPVMKPANQKNDGGRETGLVDAPTVSVHPTSGKPVEEEKIEYNIFDEVLPKLDLESEYPFADLEAGQGFFVEASVEKSVDRLVEDLNKQVNNVRQKYAMIEVDENGDEILEVVTIKTRKRNEDGTIQLEGGKPIVGANQSHRPKYIYSRNFVVKSMVKDAYINDEEGEKVPEDGVMVIRVF